MASTVLKTQMSARDELPKGGRRLLGKLGKLLHLSAPFARGDDPICLSALDASTLGRYGYTEAQITLMKEGSLR